MNVLSAITVLVTRPNPGGARLCAALQAEGANPIAMPTLTIGPPPDPIAFASTLEHIIDYDWIIFTSPQAVIAIKDYLEPQHLARVNILAIGSGTRQQLEQCGIEQIIVPNESSSEGVLTLLQFQAMQEKRVLLVTGLRGRELIATQLRERGAKVTVCVAYERLLPQIDIAPFESLMQAHAIDVIVCGSFDSVKNLKIMFTTCWHYLKKIPLIVVSERIKQLTELLGFQTIWVADNASDEAILAVLKRQKEILWQQT